MLCSFSYAYYFIGENNAADCLKDEITPSLKANDGIKLSRDVTLNHVREKVKTQCKLAYELLKEQDGYDPLIDISLYPTCIKLKEFLDRIQHFFTGVGK